MPVVVGLSCGRSGCWTVAVALFRGLFGWPSWLLDCCRGSFSKALRLARLFRAVGLLPWLFYKASRIAR